MSVLMAMNELMTMNCFHDVAEFGFVFGVALFLFVVSGLHQRFQTILRVRVLHGHAVVCADVGSAAVEQTNSHHLGALRKLAKIMRKS